MSPQFTINFRREAYRRELARARRRIARLGVWVTYFGLIALMAGLFVLDGLSLQRRVKELEVRIAQFESDRSRLQSLDVPAGELPHVAAFVRNPRDWAARLSRLAALTPPNVMLTTLAVNPDNLTGGENENELHIVGRLHPRAEQDAMQAIVAYVASLHDDPRFSSGYSTVHLVQSQAESGPGGDAEFTIQCR
jgi:hypothetical protein